MSALFLKILNMSVCASWIAAAVLILRFCLKRAPKWVNVLLWGFVAARLICPVSIESALSLIPRADAISSAVLTAPGQTAAAPVIGGAAAAGGAEPRRARPEDGPPCGPLSSPLHKPNRERRNCHDRCHADPLGRSP